MIVGVTGGCSGLGLAIIRHLLSSYSECVDIIYGDIQTHLGRQLERELQAAHPQRRIKFIECNVTKNKDLGRFYSAIDEWYKATPSVRRIVINNAGITSHKDFPLDSHDGIEQVLHVNLTSVVLSTQLAIQQRQRSSGEFMVINIASMAGLVPLGIDPVYTASKAGVVGFTQAMKGYLKLAGVSVCAVCPLFFASDLGKTSQVGEKSRRLLSQMPTVPIEQVIAAVQMAIDGGDRIAGACIAVTPKGNSVVQGVKSTSKL